MGGLRIRHRTSSSEIGSPYPCWTLRPHRRGAYHTSATRYGDTRHERAHQRQKHPTVCSGGRGRRDRHNKRLGWSGDLRENDTNKMGKIRSFRDFNPNGSVGRLGGVELLELLAEFVCAAANRRVFARRKLRWLPQSFGRDCVLLEVSRTALYFRFTDEAEQSLQPVGALKCLTLQY